MTLKGYLCAFVMAGAMLGGFSQAAMAAQLRSDTIEIPYSFKVHGAVLPAGVYRLEEISTSGLCELVNTKTGAAVAILRSKSRARAGKVAFVFHETAQGVTLSLI